MQDDELEWEKLPKCYQLSPEEKHRLFNKYIVPNFASIRSLTQRYTDKYDDIDENYNYCLAQLYNYIGSYDPEKKLDTWIHICTKRACFHQNKKRAEEASHYTDIEMCTQDELHGHGNDMMVDAGFGSLIDNISDKMYNVLMQVPFQRLSPFLMFVQGHKIREITDYEWKRGHLERKSEDIVKSRIFWAKKQLQYLLRKNGIDRTYKENKVNDEYSVSEAISLEDFCFR